MSKPKILVIDDEKPLHHGIRKALKGEGYQLSFAENGRLGLEMFEKQRPQVIFLDLRMPEMNGLAFLEAIDFAPGAPYMVVVITGHGDEDEVIRSYELGVDFFLRKPLNMVELVCLTRRCLEMQRMSGELRAHQDNLEQLVAERTRELEEQLRFQQTLVDAIPLPVFVKDREQEYIGCNKAFEKIMGLKLRKLIGRTDSDLLPRETASQHDTMDRRVLRAGRTYTYDSSLIYPDGQRHQVMVSKAGFRNLDHEVAGIIGVVTDMTERLQIEEQLTARTAELEQANTALRVLLKQVNTNQEDIEEKVLHNIKDLVLPNLDRLEASIETPREQMALRMVKSSLKKITSSFSKRLSSVSYGFSPREIQVAGYIRMGKTNKDIARLLNISKSAVEFHRNNIRQKLGLRHNKTNLRSYLLTME